MRVTVTVKQAGSRKDMLANRELILRDGIGTLGALITEIVTLSVREYNIKPVDADLLGALTKETIEVQVQAGKVGFFRRINRNKANLEKAIPNALQSFEDGLYRVFVDSQEITDLNQQITLLDGTALVFVRMTMLAGKMW